MKTPRELLLERHRAVLPQLNAEGHYNLPEITNGLAGWQAYYRSLTNLSGLAWTNSPAEDVLLALRRFDPELAELRQAATSTAQCASSQFCPTPMSTTMGTSRGRAVRMWCSTSLRTWASSGT